MKIDLFEFAKQHRTASGDAALANLPRIETHHRRGSLAWNATGSTHGRHGNLRFDLAIDGDVVLICQRCMQPMTESLHLRSKFLIAKDEDTADHLDQDDDYDVLVGSPTFDVDALIEDEVILALPIAPRHAVCPDGAADVAGVSRKPSPFAGLAGLKTARAGPPKEGDDGDG